MKNHITQLCMTLMAFLFAFTMQAQNVAITVTYTAGAWDGENGWILMDDTAGAQVAGYSTADTGPSTQTANVPLGNSISLYTWETFGDGWNGATIAVSAGATALYGPADPGSSANGAVTYTPGGALPAGGDQVFGSFPLVATCTVDCPADIVTSFNPGECASASVVVPLPVTGADCGGVPANCTTIDGPAVDLLFNGTGIVDTDFTIPGVAPVPAAATCVTEVCITVTMIADIGGAGFEQTDILDEFGNIIGQNGTSAGDCDAAGGVSVVCMPVADYNAAAADGTLTFTIVEDADIDNICATQTIQASVEVCDMCEAAINDYNGTADASDDYPSGDTEVCFTSVDAITGIPVSCCFTVTVEDLEPPVMICPGDATFNLDPGACGQVYSFEIISTDNCGIDPVPVGPPVVIEGTFGDLANCPGSGSTLSCGASLTAQVQEIDVTSYPAMFNVLEGCFVFDNSAWGASMGTVNLYCAPAGMNPPPCYKTATPDATSGLVDMLALGGVNGNALCVPFTAPYLFDATTGCDGLYIEVLTPAGAVSFNGTACNGLISDGTNTYLCSDNCGDGYFADFGFTDIDAFFGLTGQNVEDATGPDPTAPPGTNLFEAGEMLPVGVHCFQYSVTDINGNEASCDWCVTVEEFPVDLQTANLACNQNINISVDENCSVTITPDMVLEGGPYGCYENYTVTVSPGLPGAMTGNGTNAVTINAGAIAGWNGMYGPFEISVADANGNSCWGGGYMLEDKLAPTIEDCEDVTVSCVTSLNAASSTPSGVAVASESDLGLSWTMPGPVFSTGTGISAPPGAVITDVSVGVEMNHSWIGDMTLTLTAPDGTSVAFYNGACNAPGDGNMNATFADGNATTCTPTAGVQDCTVPQLGATVSGAAGPASPLSAFAGGSPNGTWTLDGVDNFFGDEGCLLGWNLTVSWELPVPLRPTMVDNCGDASMVPYDVVLSSDDCAGDVIERTWVATDSKGNSGSCSQLITVENITIADVVFPDSPVELGCGSGTSPDITGYPTVGGSPIINGQTCSLYYTYTDQEIPACAPGCNGNVKVIRTWTLIDWCNAGDAPAVFVQVIKAIDNDGPTFVSFEGETDLSVDPWTCTYSGPIPVPTLHDECTEILSYTVTGPAGVTFIGGEIVGAPKGIHTLTYTAEDCCGNTTQMDVDINVYDGSAPVPVAYQNIILSLTSDGQLGGAAKIYTHQVDNNSYDGCTDVHVEIRRATDACNISGNTTYDNTGHPNDSGSDPDGGQFVKFCCADIYDSSGAAANTDTYPDGTTVDWNNVVVWMRVWDDGDMNGVFGSAGDNYNETWVNVRVENKFVPQINCVPDVVLACNMDYEDLNMTGVATANGLCGELCTGFTDVADVDGCGVGTVFRFWWIDFNCNGERDAEDFRYFCAAPQVITLTPLAPFDGNINWPRDFTGEPGQNDPLDPSDGCDANLGEPSWNDAVCSLVAASVTDIDTFEFEQGACYKVLKEWTVIDWCQFDANDPDLNTVPDADDDDLIPGYWTQVQTIKYIDVEKPEFEACDDEMFEVDENCINNNVMLFRTATDDGGCSGDSSTWLKWYVTVDLWADGTIDHEFTSFGNENPNVNSDGDGNGIPGKIVAATESGEAVKIDLSGVIIENSMFNHVVVWKVTDGCGNVRSCESTFMVTDKKAPTPYCVDLSTALMENDMVEIWACDFDLGAFDNCTAKENLLFTFDDYTPSLQHINVPHYYNSSSNAIGFPPNVPAAYLNGTARYWNGVNCAGRVFTQCGENDVEIHVWDEKLNEDYCEVTLLVGGEECEGVSIAGRVATETGELVNDIEMQNISDVPVDNQMTAPTTSSIDDTEVSYEFHLLSGFDYNVTGNKMDDYMNGVSTLDLVLIQKHILGLQTLDSPYKVIAADVNNNGDVTAVDLVEMRKLILGIYEELPNNASWRLVDADQTFADNTDPFPFTETLSYQDLTVDMPQEDFVAVKICDVNGSATANLQSATTEVRSSNSLNLEIDEMNVNAGQEVSIDVMSSNFTNVYGYQFTMNLSGATLARVESGALAISNSNVGVLNNNTVTMSWNNANGVSADKDEVLFTIVLAADKTATTSELMSINSNVTRAEAYVGATTEIVNVELGVRTDEGTEIASAFELFQNEPNPFNGATQIGFNLPEASAATVTIFDVTGQVVKIIKTDGERGYNTVTVQKGDLGVAGVLYYQLESGDFTATKKMIVIE